MPAAAVNRPGMSAAEAISASSRCPVDDHESRSHNRDANCAGRRHGPAAPAPVPRFRRVADRRDCPAAAILPRAVHRTGCSASSSARTHGPAIHPHGGDDQLWSRCRPSPGSAGPVRRPVGAGGPAAGRRAGIHPRTAPGHRPRPSASAQPGASAHGSRNPMSVAATRRGGPRRWAPSSTESTTDGRSSGTATAPPSSHPGGAAAVVTEGFVAMPGPPTGIRARGRRRRRRALRGCAGRCRRRRC